MRIALETKNGGADVEVKEAITALTKTTTDALSKLKGDLKGLNERLDQFELKAARPRAGGGDPEDKAAVAAMHKALAVFIRTGDDRELKALGSDDDAAGGYLITPVMSDRMTRRIFDQSPMRRLARTITISVGDSWQEPVDMNDVGAEWVGEREARPETTNPTPVGLLTVPVNEIYAHQTVTQRLLDDSRFDIGAWIEGKIFDKFGRAEGLACVSGDGVKRPKGFMAYDVDSAGDSTRAAAKLQFVVSGSAAAVSDSAGGVNGVMDLYWSMRAPHRKNATWLMSSATANAVDKLKDANENYIWRTGITADAPPTLLGRPVEFDENMPAIGAGTFPIAFGDWQDGYVIVDKAGIKTLRDPFTNKPNVIFYAYRRTGGGVANFDAIKLLKCST